METDSGDRCFSDASPAADAPHGASAGVGVRVDAVAVSELSDAVLHRRLAEIGRASSALTALHAETLRELTRRTDTATAEQTAKDTLRISGRAARSDVKLSVALGGLDATRSGLENGTIPEGNAKLIARASTEGPIDEAWLAERAQREGYDEFRRTVARHQAEASSDDGASLLERQRQARSGKIFTSRHDGMVVLSAQFDPVTGARLATVIAAAERRLYSGEDPKSRPSHSQRTADAIAMLILEPDTARPAGTSLLVVADYDAVNHELTNARLSDGTPIPIGEIGPIAADAQVLPAIFNHATGDLRMGRSRRTATDLQRAALALRDQGCIGCDMSPDYCQAHHVIEWQHGGRTDYDNLVLVCNDCHHKIHDHGHTVESKPCTGRYELRVPASPSATSNSTDSRAPPA